VNARPRGFSFTGHTHIWAEGAGATHLFYGRPKVFFLAHCVSCWPDRWAPMPFGSEAERDKWAGAHLSGPLSKDHEVQYFVEVRT
jgi:hypothetical protein